MAGGVPNNPSGEKPSRPRLFNKSVFARYTLASLAAEQVRTAVTVVGIALASCLLTGVLVSLTSLTSALLDQVLTSEGAWEVRFTNVAAQEGVDDIKAAFGEHLDRVGVKRDLGAVALSQDEAALFGGSFEVVSVPYELDEGVRAGGSDGYDLVVPDNLSQGRWPEAPGEVVLPSYLEGRTFKAGGPSAFANEVPSGFDSAGALELGSTVTLALGRRHLNGERLGASYPNVWLGNEAGSTGSADGQAGLAETLEDLQETRAYTVVGFSSTATNIYVSQDEPAPSFGDIYNVYLSATGIASAYELDDLVSDALNATQSNETLYHTRLLAMQGLDGSTTLLGTLKLIVAILAVVIAGAAVSLISNAFTISISERTRQFGLLLSLGASGRQLRRTVLFEALLLGAVGIPLGMALGVAGTWAAFQVTGSGWAALLGTEQDVALVIEPWAIAATAALSALAVLLSAWRPAVRASRVSAVDAIRRTQDVRLPRRFARRLARRGPATAGLAPALDRPRGLAARLAGMPGFLAGRTLALTKSKARVAVASLAVSVTLLVTAGALDHYLSGMVDLEDGSDNADLEVVVQPVDATSATTPNSEASARGLLALLSELAEKTRALPGIDDAMTGARIDPRVMRLPEDCLNWDVFNKASQEGYGDYAPTSDGYLVGMLYLIDASSWARLVQDLGLDPSYADAGHPSCVVLNRSALTIGDRTQVLTPFNGSLVGATLDLPVFSPGVGGEEPQFLYSWTIGGIGDLSVYYPDAPDAESTVTPLNKAVDHTVSVPVAAAPSALPDWFFLGSDSLMRTSYVPVVIMSADAALNLEKDSPGAVVSGSWSDYARIFVNAGDPSQAIDDVQGLVNDYAGSISNVTYTNIAEINRQNRATALTVRVFMYCFSGITGAIAVANVFNTISSGLALRTREFAILRSCGMGERDFKKMIVLECSSYALRGLVIGAVLSLAVTFALWRAINLSYFMDFEVPWTNILMAFGLVMTVLAASAAYGLTRTRALNLTEALRQDAL